MARKSPYPVDNHMKMCYTWRKEMIMDLKIAKKRYTQQRFNAKKRGIEWQFTLDSWLKVWIESGKWDLRGKSKNSYVMSRIGDVGPYSPDNVVIKTNSENSTEAHIGNEYRLGRKNTAESTLKNKLSHIGKTQTEQTKNKISLKKQGVIRPKAVKEKISQSIIQWHQKRKAELNGHNG